MDATDALVRMRYRPSGDVLVGQVELPASASTLAADALTDTVAHGSTAMSIDHDLVEQLDADTTRTWRHVGHGELRGRTVLASFQVLGAAARLRTDRAVLDEVLPAVVASAAAQMVTAAAAASARLRVDDRVRARAEVELPVPLTDLLGPAADAASAPSERVGARVDLGSTRALAAALVHLADAIEADQAELVARHRGGPTDQSERFVSAVRALASIVSRHRQPAPSAAGPAIEAVRGGLPLTGSERQLVRRSLGDLDDPHRWRAAAGTLEAVASALDEHRRRPEQAR